LTPVRFRRACASQVLAAALCTTAGIANLALPGEVCWLGGKPERAGRSWLRAC